MYRNIIIGLLLSGCISSIVISEDVNTSETPDSTVTAGPATPEMNSTSLRTIEQSVTESQPTPGREQRGPTTPEMNSTSLRTIEQSVTGSQLIPGREQREARNQIVHPFSEAVIIAIIFGVMAVIIGVILLLASGIRRLRTRGNVQPTLPQKTDDPLSSVETGNPVLPQDDNE